MGTRLSQQRKKTATHLKERISELSETLDYDMWKDIIERMSETEELPDGSTKKVITNRELKDFVGLIAQYVETKPTTQVEVTNTHGFDEESARHLNHLQKLNNMLDIKKIKEINPIEDGHVVDDQ